MLTLYKGFVCPCTEYASRMCEAPLTNFFFVPSTPSIQLTVFRHTVGTLVLSQRYFHGFCSSECVACMPLPSYNPGAQDFVLTFILILSILLIQGLASFIPSTLSLVNSGTLYYSVFTSSYEMKSFRVEY